MCSKLYEIIIMNNTCTILVLPIFIVVKEDGVQLPLSCLTNTKDKTCPCCLKFLNPLHQKIILPNNKLL